MGYASLCVGGWERWAPASVTEKKAEVSRVVDCGVSVFMCYCNEMPVCRGGID